MLDTSPPQDLIALDDAAAEFAVSRRTLYRLIGEQGLSRFRRRGDRKTYVSRQAVRDLLGFKRVE